MTPCSIGGQELRLPLLGHSAWKPHIARMQAAVAVGTNEACLTAAVRALAAVLARHPDPAWWLSPEALVRRLTAQEAFALPAVLKASMAETVLRMAQRPAGRPMS